MIRHSIETDRGAVARLRALDRAAHLADATMRRRYVGAVFDVVAPSYDRFTRLFSLGMDARWKRRVGALLARHLRPEAVVLDLACGTGDLGWVASRVGPGATVIALDISRRMIGGARARVARDSLAAVRLIVADMAALPLRHGSVDAVTAGYGFRNAPDPRAALRQAAAVLRRGGLLASLDFFLPPGRLWRRVFLGYLWVAGTLIGSLWHRAPGAYGYIAASLERFVSLEQFSRALEQQGFAVEVVEPKLGGGIGIHLARRV